MASYFLFLWLWPPVANQIDQPVASHTPQLTIDERVISQVKNAWHIRYRLTFHDTASVELSATDIDISYDSWVSNSSTPPHVIPRQSQTKFSLIETNTVQTIVIASPNDRLRCRERVSIAFSTNVDPEDQLFKGRLYFIPLRLIPNSSFWCYLRLEHEHFLYGTYNPLLGTRHLIVRLGVYHLFDELVLNEINPVQSKPLLSAVPKDRLDERQFHSAPDSLYLAADVPGCQYFRFDDIQARYGSTFILSFWYLAAIGTEGTCHARIMEYQDTPNAWYRLDAGFDEQLLITGRWRNFEKIFTLTDHTTTIAIDFRIIGANIGEMWIDDVRLVELDRDN